MSVSPTPLAAPERRKETRDPKKLRVHKLIAGQPELSDDDPEFIRIVESIREHGFDEAIKITEDGAIADGRHRWRASKRLKLVEVPVELVTEDEVAEIALRSLIARRHYNQSQLAFASYPLLKPAFAEAEKRRLAQLKFAGTGIETQSLRIDAKKGSEIAVKTVDDWAAELAISLRLLQQAKEVHDLFSDPKKRTITDRDDVTEDDVTFREFFQPRLMRGEEPYGLGAVLTATKQILDLERKAGAGKGHTGGRPKGVEKQLDLFTETVTDEIKRWDYWRKFDPETRGEHWKRVQAVAAKLDPDKLSELAEYHSRMAKEFARAAKAASTAEN